MRKKLCLILVVRPGLLSLGEGGQEDMVFQAGEDNDDDDDDDDDDDEDDGKEECKNGEE